MAERQYFKKPNSNTNATGVAVNTHSPLTHVDRLGGRPLDTPTQSHMSARFGHDFSQVRIHTDSRAAESAQALHAEAFTDGTDIVFKEGAFDLGSPYGQRLIAHELTHVVQQKIGRGDPGRISQRSDAAEREAEQAADLVAAGESVSVQAAPSAGISRFELEDCIANPLSLLPNGPASIGHKQDPSGEVGGYAYGDYGRFGPAGVPGVGFGIGHEAVGSHKWDLGSSGQYGSITAQGETGMGIKGNSGAWSDDNGQNVRYGQRISAIGAPPISGVAGSINYDDGHGDSFGVDAQAATANAELSVGDDGFTAGAGATAGGIGVSAKDTHDSGHFGVSAGPSIGGRLHWGEGKDGYRNYGIGADFDIFSADFTTNDPLRAAARYALGPTMAGVTKPLADALLPDGNVTDKAAGLFGLTTKNADLGTTWDVAKGAASSAYNAGSAAANWGGTKALEASKGIAGAEFDAAGWGLGKFAQASSGVGRAAGAALGWGAERASEAKDGVLSAASDAATWGSDKAASAEAGILGAASGAEAWGASKASAAETGILNAASGAEAWGLDRLNSAESGILSAAAGAGAWEEEKLGSAASGAFNAASDAVGWGGQKMDDAASGVGGFIDQASHWDSIGDAFTGVGGAASGALGWLGGTAAEAVSGIGDAAGGALGWLGDAASEAKSGIGSAASGAAGWLGDTVGEASSGIGTAATNAAGWLGDTASEAKSGVAGALGSAEAWAGSAAGEAASGVRGAAGSAAGWLSDTAGEAVGGVSSAVDEAKTWAGDAAGEAKSGISNAASSAAGWLSDTASEIF